MTPVRRPYGTWPSPLSVEDVVAGSLRLADVRISAGSVWWSEGRPDEGGRTVIVRRPLDGSPAVDVLPVPFSARTTAHEYGGGAWWLRGETLFFANAEDQRIHRLDPDASPVPITPEPPSPRALRYADGVVTADGAWIICARERHRDDGEPVEELVVLPVDGSVAPEPLVSGPDFVSSPRLSPDGRHLAWLQWNHPDMPWDSTQLWVGELDQRGSRAQPVVTTARLVAGGDDESIFQPEWQSAASLIYVSDRSGWWNLYRHPLDVDGAVAGPDEALAPIDAELGVPQWGYGMSRFAPVSGGALVCTLQRGGFDSLVLLRPSADRFEVLDLDVSVVSSVAAQGDTVAVVAASSTEEAAVSTFRVMGGRAVAAARASGPAKGRLVAGQIAVPEPIEAPSPAGAVHALLYRPINPDSIGPSAESPPLIVRIHGGPTAVAPPELYLPIQFWTSRGYAVCDVNYRGSSGFGRPYRRALDGEWGRADVEDCVAVARHLAETGVVDGRRLAIRGGSAGGFTALAALAFHDVFAAAVSLYGVTDLAALAQTTHKFESRYLDRLVGPLPEEAERYRERSPLHHADRIDRPVLLLQGADDMVVPLAQAEQLAAALQARGVPCELVVFEGEAHGFRKKETLVRALEAEADFYERVLL